jgi:phosphate binding protein
MTATTEMTATAEMTMTAELTATAQATTTAVAAVELPAVDPAAVSGNINTGGSSTVGPLTIAVAERFKQDGYPDEIKVDVVGSGAGIDRFCRGELDIANASRAINDEEIATCRAANLEPLSLLVGVDALSIVVNSENDFVDNLTTEQLAAIFSGEARTWADVNPAWPAEAIQIFSPGTDSGTYDFFVETVFDGRENADNIIPQVQGVQLSENDNVLVQGVEGSRNAIGFFGFAYYNENRDRLKSVRFNGIAPNASTVASGAYGFSRPLFVITTAGILQEKPQVAAFVNYYLTNVNRIIRNVGYFPLPDNEWNQSKQQFLDVVQ